MNYRVDVNYNVHDNVYVGDNDVYGKTLMAKRDFKKHELVWMITGPIVKIPTTYTIPISHRLFIDPVPYNNVVRRMNHSCNPNCGVWHRNEMVAMKDIAADEEVTIDYAMIVPTYGVEMTEDNARCACGAKSCRGRLGSYDTLPDDIRKKYQRYISEAVLEWPKEEGRYLIPQGVEPPVSAGDLYTSPDLAEYTL